MATTSARIVVADDDPLIRRCLAQRFRAHGHEVMEAGSVDSVLGSVRAGVDLVVLGDSLPGMRGAAVLQHIRELDSDVRAILLTASTNVETVIEGMKAGAFQVAHKPFDLDDIVFLVSRALECTQLRREVRRLHASQARPFGLEAIVGQSAAMEILRSVLARVAMSPARSVLLIGESGTGKDLAARVLHYNSDRASRPFLSITCSAIPANVLEDELFGHERRPSADEPGVRRGLFESAEGGTVFLDEIGGMSQPLQAKLLRVLDEQSLQRVGGVQDITVNVRVIAATSCNLDEEVEAGRFRKDLSARLNVLPILLPPLRQHMEDVPALLGTSIETFNRELRKHVKGISPAALEALQAYSWPGNTRELQNAVERAMLRANGDYLQPSDFRAIIPEATVTPTGGDFQLPAAGVNLDALERSLVTQALVRCGGNQTRAAGLLGMNRDQIRYRIEKYGLPRPHHA